MKLTFKPEKLGAAVLFFIPLAVFVTAFIVSTLLQRPVTLPIDAWGLLLIALPGAAVCEWVVLHTIDVRLLFGSVTSRMTAFGLMFLPLLISVCVACAFLNSVFDPAPETLHTATVLDKIRTGKTGRRISVPSWREPGDQENLSVTPAQYALIEPHHSQVNFGTKPGFLRLEWVTFLRLETAPDLKK